MNFFYDAFIGWITLHCLWGALHMHGANPGTSLDCDLDHFRVTLQASNVVYYFSSILYSFFTCLFSCKLCCELCCAHPPTARARAYWRNQRTPIGTRGATKSSAPVAVSKNESVSPSPRLDGQKRWARKKTNSGPAVSLWITNGIDTRKSFAANL